MSKWKEFTLEAGGTVWINLDMISDFEMVDGITLISILGQESYYEVKEDLDTVYKALIKREKEQND